MFLFFPLNFDCAVTKVPRGEKLMKRIDLFISFSFSHFKLLIYYLQQNGSKSKTRWS